MSTRLWSESFYVVKRPSDRQRKPWHPLFSECIQGKMGNFEKKIHQQAFHHFPSSPPGPSRRLTDKVFSFKPLKAVNVKPQLPVPYHIFWPPFVAQTTPHMGLRGAQPTMRLVWHSGRSFRGSRQMYRKHKQEPSSSAYVAVTENVQDRTVVHKCHNQARATNVSSEHDIQSGIRTPELLKFFITATADTNDCVSSEEHRVWFMKEWLCYIDYVCSMYLLFKCCCWSYIRGYSMGIDRGGCFRGWVSQYLHLLFSAMLDSCSCGPALKNILK